MKEVLLLLSILLWWVLSSATTCILGNASAAKTNLDKTIYHVVIITEGKDAL